MITIPAYQINEQIYESAKSRVYRGYRAEDQLPVVLKVLREEHPQPEELARCRQEYNLLRSLNIAGVIRAYDLLKYQHTLVIVEEDFGGESLERLLPDRQLPPETFLPLAVQIVEALEVTTPETLDAAALAALPPELQAALEQVLIQLDPEAIREVIDTIRAHDAALAEVLSAWAGEFQYDRILQMIRVASAGPNLEERS